MQLWPGRGCCRGGNLICHTAAGSARCGTLMRWVGWGPKGVCRGKGWVHLVWNLWSFFSHCFSPLSLSESSPLPISPLQGHMPLLGQTFYFQFSLPKCYHLCIPPLSFESAIGAADTTVVFPALCIWLRSGKDSSQSNCCNKCFLASRCALIPLPCCSWAVSQPCIKACRQAERQMVMLAGCWHWTRALQREGTQLSSSCSVTEKTSVRSAAMLFLASASPGLQMGNLLSISATGMAESILPRACVQALCCWISKWFPDRYAGIGSQPQHGKPKFTSVCCQYPCSVLDCSSQVAWGYWEGLRFSAVLYATFLKL